VPHADRVIHAGPLHVINVAPPPGRVIDTSAPEFALNLLLETAPLLRVGFNRPPRWLAVSPGAMVATPPDTACEFIGEAAAHVLAVAIPKAAVDAVAQETGARIELREEQAFRDPRLVQQLVRLWHAVADDAPASQLLADHVMRTVIDALAARTGTASRVSGLAARERLTTATLRRLRDYVEHRLSADLDVPTMAQIAGTSPAHFARAFAATVGMTPFRYVMTRRLARAHELLRHTRRPAHAIALDVGFKTPSHFASRFHREFGVPPTEIRSFRTVETTAAG
jgi:AraC family transcriptional regulator